MATSATVQNTCSVWRTVCRAKEGGVHGAKHPFFAGLVGEVELALRGRLGIDEPVAECGGHSLSSV
jgi:hypothetical protein